MILVHNSAVRVPVIKLHESEKLIVQRPGVNKKLRKLKTNKFVCLCL